MSENRESMSKPPGMTDLQWRFLNEFVIDFNASAAAKRAGIQKNPGKRGWDLAKSVNVRRALKELLEERNELWENSHSRVVQEALNLAMSNVKDFVEWDDRGVTLIASSKLTRDETASIMSVEQIPTEYGTKIKVKREPKSKALELLMRNLGLLDLHPGDESNRGAFAKWAEEQRGMAEEEAEREQLKREIAELREQLGKLREEQKERNDDDRKEEAGE